MHVDEVDTLPDQLTVHAAELVTRATNFNNVVRVRANCAHAFFLNNYVAFPPINEEQ